MTTASPAITRDDLLQAFNYTPTAAQKEILDDEHKLQLVAGGWRGGKSQTAAVKAALGTMQFIAMYPDQAAGKVAWLVAQSYELTRAEFNYITVLLKQVYPGITNTSRVDPGEIKIPVKDGLFTIKTKSASDPQTLAMEAPVWIVLCEAAQVSVDVYENLRGRTVEAKQRFPEFGWLHLEGTFESSLGWYAAMWQKWQTPAIQAQQGARSFSLPTWTNTHIFPEGQNDPEWLKLKADTPDSLFSEKYLGVPVPPSGRVHAAFDPSVHVRDVSYDPELPVYLGIDPGYSGQPSTYAVEVAQLHKVGEHGFPQWHIVDEIAMNKFDRPNFSAHDVCVEAMRREWWKNDMKHAVMDIAGRQHNATSEDSNKEIWRKTTGMVIFDQPVPIKAGIDRFDMALKQDFISGEPGLLFSPKAQLIISELGGAPNPFDGETHVYQWHVGRDGEVSGKVPKDQYCDGIKALTYMMVNVQGFAFDNNARKTIRVKSRRRRR